MIRATTISSTVPSGTSATGASSRGHGCASTAAARVTATSPVTAGAAIASRCQPLFIGRAASTRTSATSRTRVAGAQPPAEPTSTRAVPTTIASPAYSPVM